MNREIKFKMWGGNKMFYDIENVYACLMQQIAFNCTQPNSHQIPYDHAGLFGAVWLQYIGIKDKNGKEIYHKDILVKNEYPYFDEGKPNYVATVEWIYSQWQTVLHCVNPAKRGISSGINGGMNDDGLDEGSITEWEIIGNIFEHPELLK